ncbi:MAG: tetratricopeptide repeat protein [Spirochaetaceae bacterium]|jgi:tetratricopeptide (TPR) repeat protein|nr:tetratricopeptide repeat protein [Spirochaetaceae bacterium]
MISMGKKAFFPVLCTAFLFYSCVTTDKAVPPADTQEPGVAAVPGETDEFLPSEFAMEVSEKLDEGLFDEALDLFEEIPPEYADDKGLNYLYASLLMSAGKVDQAEQAAVSLLEADPTNTDVLFLNTLIAKAGGDSSKKSVLLKEILEIDPENADANAELGNEQMKKKNFLLARTYFQKSLASAPDNSVALTGYGQVNYYLGNFEESRNSFLRLQEVDPRNSLSWSYLAKLDAEDERYGSAAENMEKAIALAPAYYDYWIDYGDYLRRIRRPGDAIDAWTEAIRIDGSYFLAYIYRGALYDELQRYSEAAADYRMAAKANPSYYFVYESLGILLWKEKNWKECRQAFYSAYEKNPSNISFILMISACYEQERNLQASKDFLSQAIKRVTRNSLEYYVARLYHDRNGDNDVLVRIGKEPDLNKKGKMLFYVAQYYQANGREDLANKYFLEISLIQRPMFFEARLAEWALADSGMQGIAD